MAPATLAGATPRLRRGGWTREAIIIAIQEWVATYGEPPRAADWNPSSAKWSGQLWRVERYRAGRADGSAWPALNSAKRPFGGSLKAAVEAAGFEPAKPGPKRRSDVDPEQADRAVISPEGRAMLGAALARAREAERRLAVVEGRLDRARESLRSARAAVAAKPKVVRERVVDEAALARAERRTAKAGAVALAARADVADARMDAAEARAAAKRLAARLERAEATIATLRGERRDLRASGARLEDRAVALERMLASARVEADRSPDVVTVREASPAAAEVRGARRAARDAELRAARAERELRETVAAIRGEPRRLTATELAELRAAGPSGPAVMAEALKALAAARRAGNPVRLRDALNRVARAAVTWQERI